MDHVEDELRADGHVARNVTFVALNEQFGADTLDGLQMLDGVVDDQRRRRRGVDLLFIAREKSDQGNLLRGDQTDEQIREKQTGTRAH